MNCDYKLPLSLLSYSQESSPYTYVTAHQQQAHHPHQYSTQLASSYHQPGDHTPIQGYPYSHHSTLKSNQSHPYNSNSAVATPNNFVTGHGQYPTSAAGPFYSASGQSFHPNQLPPQNLKLRSRDPRLGQGPLPPAGSGAPGHQTHQPHQAHHASVSPSALSQIQQPSTTPGPAYYRGSSGHNLQSHLDNSNANNNLGSNLSGLSQNFEDYTIHTIKNFENVSPAGSVRVVVTRLVYGVFNLKEISLFMSSLTSFAVASVLRFSLCAGTFSRGTLSSACSCSASGDYCFSCCFWAGGPLSQTGRCLEGRGSPAESTP